MPTGRTGAGCRVSGYTEIRNSICVDCHITFIDNDPPNKEIPYICPNCGGHTDSLLVAFNSIGAEGLWGQEYQKERVIYCMRHRHDKIPDYLRTGGKLPFLKSKKGEAERLSKLNLNEGG